MVFQDQSGELVPALPCGGVLGFYLPKSYVEDINLPSKVCQEESKFGQKQKDPATEGRGSHLGSPLKRRCLTLARSKDQIFRRRSPVESSPQLSRKSETSQVAAASDLVPVEALDGDADRRGGRTAPWGRSLGFHLQSPENANSTESALYSIATCISATVPAIYQR